MFHKYVLRAAPQAPQASKAIETATMAKLDELRARETKILMLWTAKKKQLDQCQQFVLLEESAKQRLDWLHEKGETHLSTRPHSLLKLPRERLEVLYEENLLFKQQCEQQLETVRIFLGLGKGIVEDCPRDKCVFTRNSIVLQPTPARRRHSAVAEDGRTALRRLLGAVQKV